MNRRVQGKGMAANVRKRKEMTLAIKDKLAKHEASLTRFQSILFWSDMPAKVQFVVLCVLCHLALEYDQFNRNLSLYLPPSM